MSYRHIKLFVYLFLAIFLIYFFAQNSVAKADFHFFGLLFPNVPVIILMFLSFCGGMLFWVLFNYITLPFKKKLLKEKNTVNKLKEKNTVNKLKEKNTVNKKQIKST